METTKSFIDIVWIVIQSVCVLYTFGSIIWKIIPGFWKEKLKQLFRHMSKQIRYFDETSVIHERLLDKIALIDGVDFNHEIRFSIDNAPANVPAEMISISEKLKKENDERLKKGESPVFADLHPYAVHKMDVHREGDREYPVFHVILRESSYFYSLVSVKAKNEIEQNAVLHDLFERLIKNPSNASPDEYDIVHAFGLNTLVLTKDSSFVFSKRNRNTVSSAPGCLHLSVGEHLNTDVLDLDNNGEPNAIESVVKGLLQELGVKVNEEERKTIHFYDVAFSKNTYQYGALGFTYLSDHSNSEIESNWHLSKDGHYESEELVFIDADIVSIVNYLNENTDVVMTKFAMLNVCIALMKEHQFGWSLSKIEKELKKLRPDALL